MTSTTRILTGSLATLAVASGVSLVAPAAYADAPARPCGQPAVAAVFATVVHEAEVRPVPAVTHEEWRWERQVSTVLHEYATVVTPAVVTRTWTRALSDLVELQWSRTVVTQEAHDAVPATPEVGEWRVVDGVPTGSRVEYEYVQQQTNRTRWEAAGWNAEKSDVDKGQGWTRTGNAREWVVTQAATPGSAAVPEISHVDYTWAASSPGPEWTQTGATPRTTPGGTETQTTHGSDTPSGTGWTLAHTDTVPAAVRTVWAEQAPDGYADTGSDPRTEVTTESTDHTSASAPQGDGWSKVAGSQVTIVDQDATTELVGGDTEDVLVRDALPATAACPVTRAPGAEVAGPRASGTHTTSHATAAAATTSTTVLPATGNPASPLLLATGIGALLAGGTLVQVGRRRRTS
jgi:hypothetical protein